MAGARKLQAEVDRTLKKVQEGIEVFNEIWEKVYNAAGQNQKEKYELDLKKEIKKLQRSRDQIKNWIAGTEVKDKKPLTEARKRIEEKMEQFKVCERETKTKAYSKEGLAQQTKVDPQAKERAKTREMCEDFVSQLNIQIEDVEVELEKESNKGKKANAATIDTFDNRISHHKGHIQKLEQIIRLLDNDVISIEEVNSLEDSIQFYLESDDQDDEDFLETFHEDVLYEQLNLDQLSNNAGMVVKDLDDGNSRSHAVHDDDDSDSRSKKVQPSPAKASSKLKHSSNSSSQPVAIGRAMTSKSSEAKDSKSRDSLQGIGIGKGSNSNKSSVGGGRGALGSASSASSSSASNARSEPSSSESRDRQVQHQQEQARAQQQQRMHLQTQARHEQQHRHQHWQQQHIQQQHRQGSGHIKDADSGRKDVEDNPRASVLNEARQAINSSFLHFPDERDLVGPKQYKPRNPCRTIHNSFPTVPAGIFDKAQIFEKFDTDTLFFIFYFQQGTYQQHLAARELKRQSWRYHQKYMTWFQRHEEPTITTDEMEQGTYVYFDYESGWCQRIKAEFTFEYKYLEDELSI